MSDLYDGQATLQTGDDRLAVRVRLMGNLNPIDGRYHWQGTIFGSLPADVLKQPQVTLSIDDRTSPGRITERTQQGDYSVTGTGAPPFA